MTTAMSIPLRYVLVARIASARTDVSSTVRATTGCLPDRCWSGGPALHEHPPWPTGGTPRL